MSEVTYFILYILQHNKGRHQPFWSDPLNPIFCLSLIFLSWDAPFSPCAGATLACAGSGNLYFFPLYCFPLLLCIVHLRRLSYLSLLFSGILHSVVYIFPFLLCLSPLFLAICKMFSDNHFALLHFFFLGMVFLPWEKKLVWLTS